MAEERVIRIKGDLSQAEQSFKELTDTIREQKDILISLEEEAFRLQKTLDNTPKNQIAAQTQLKDKLKEVNTEIKDQRLALKRLNLEKQNQKADISFQKRQGFITKELIKSRRNTAALNMVTNGYFGSLQKGVKLLRLTRLGFISAAKGVGVFSKALIATGIGAIVVAVGLLVANFDKLKELVNGVSSETTNLLKDQQKSVELEEKKLETINGQENILKQQGKSEKEILQLKIQQTQQVIGQLEAQLETQKQIRKSQIETAERNKSILSGILQALTFPLATLLEAVDSVGRALGQDFGLREGLYNGVAGLLFDPEKTKEEGDKTVEETEKKLLKLKNSLAGFQLSVQAIDTKTDADTKKQLLNQEQEFQDRLEAIRLGGIATQEQLRQEELRKNREYYQELMNDAIAIFGLGSSEYLALLNAFNMKQEEINGKYADANVEIAEKESMAKEEQLVYYADALASIGTLIGKETASGKALAVAASLINTYAAIAGNLKAFSGVPVPGYAIAQAVATGIQGFMAVKNILATKIPGQSGGGSVSGGQPITASAPSFNIVGATPTSQLASAIGDQQQEPVQAYVVSQDVTSAQSLENNIIEGATLGD